MSAKMNSALSSYSDYGYNSEIEYADPHRLIQMLFEGALKRISFAKGAMQRKDIAGKGKYISQTIDIVGGLSASLDMENGGEISQNLASLYDYISRRLVTANLENSEEILNEVSDLLRDVKTAWDAINVTSEEAVEVATETKVPETMEQTAQAVEKIEETPATKPVKPAKPVNARANRALKAYSS